MKDEFESDFNKYSCCRGGFFLSHLFIVPSIGSLPRLFFIV